jgi:hypothetical protein
MIDPPISSSERSPEKERPKAKHQDTTTAPEADHCLKRQSPPPFEIILLALPEKLKIAPSKSRVLNFIEVDVRESGPDKPDLLGGIFTSEVWFCQVY